MVIYVIRLPEKIYDRPHIYDVSAAATNKLHTRDQIYRWISKGIDAFTEWYQPVDFGNGVVAYETRPPSWNPVKDSISDKEGGMAKWNFIIKKHIPNIKGKRVLDLGCSCGLFSLALARMGAAEVIGIDRDFDISYHSTSSLPRQNIVNQANFVKRAFELLEKKKFPITYIAADIADIKKLNLGTFDLILGLCVVYHELDRTPRLIKTLSEMTGHIILQANQVHTGELGKYSDKLYLASQLFEYGFTKVEIEAPRDYMLPVIVGKKS